MDTVYLVIRKFPTKDDIISIWTTEELANSAVIFHKAKNPLGWYAVKEWKLNVTYPQWD